MTEDSLLIRRMLPTDLSAVVALEQACGLSSWGVAGYVSELIHPSAILLTAVCREQIAGYFSGRVMADEFELFSIAIAPIFRRQGIGQALLNAGLSAIRLRGIDRCILEVRAANSAAQQLYNKGGFKPIGQRRNYFHQPDDDAILMARSAILSNDPAD